MFYFKVDPESEYYKAYMKARNGYKDFKKIHEGVCAELGLEPLKEMSINPNEFWYDYSKLPDEKKHLFKKDGRPKRNNKLARGINEIHKKYVEKCGLTDYESTSSINFTYGVMRHSESQRLMFLYGLDTIYLETSWDLKNYYGNGSMPFLIPVTEIDYVNAHKAVLEANAS